MEILSRAVFGLASVVLMLLALALILYGGYQIVEAATGRDPDIGKGVLDAVGYVIISIAVFDVAKYLLEEEVIQSRELRNASEARRSMTKFVTTIAIAVFLEALVLVFQTSKTDIEKILYPTLLLVAGTLLIVGLGVFQRLSASVETQIAATKGKEA